MKIRNFVLDNFVIGYLTCALWSTNDNSNEQGGDPLEDNYYFKDLSDQALALVMDDCQGFQVRHAELLLEYYSKYETNDAGHDFWLTRNGHGCGFWDRGLGQLGNELTIGSRLYGSVNLYVGDDGKLYIS